MKEFIRSKFVLIVFISAIYGTIIVNLIGFFVLFTDDRRHEITAPFFNPREEFIEHQEEVFKKSYHGNLASFGLFYIDIFGDDNNQNISLVVPTKGKRETMCQSYFFRWFWPVVFNIYTYPARLMYDDQYECTLSSIQFNRLNKDELSVKEYINNRHYYQDIFHPTATLFYIDKRGDVDKTYWFYEYVEDDKEHIILLPKSYSVEK